MQRQLADTERDKLLQVDSQQTAVPIIDDVHLRDYLRVCFKKRYQYAPFFCVPGKLVFVQSSAGSNILLTIDR